MRMRSIVPLVAVLALAVGGILVWQSRGTKDRGTAAAQSDVAAAAKVEAPARPLSPEAQQVTDKQEHDERAQLQAIASELKLTTQQSDQLVAALAEMQQGRRDLFAKLAARAIAVEGVSAKLRDLREAMHAAFARDVGDEQAKSIRERMRTAHGAERLN